MVHRGASTFVEKAIQSVLNQDYRRLEFIFVDDGATPDIREILASKFSVEQHIEFRMIANQGSGLIAGCRTALLESKGDWIFRLDSDDIASSSAISELLSYAESNKLDLVYPDFEEIDEKGSFLRSVENKIEYSDLIESEFHGACCLIRKEFLLRVEGYTTKAERQDGFEILVKAVIAGGNIGHIPRKLFKYRKHSSNISQNELMLSSARNTILKEILKSRLVDKPTSILVLPFRNSHQEEFFRRRSFNGKSILDKVLGDFTASDSFDDIVILTQHETKDLKEVARKSNIRLEHVPSESSIDNMIEKARIDRIVRADIVVAATLNFPFRLKEVYDAALAKMLVFDYERIFSAVRYDKHVYKIGKNGMELNGLRQELRINRDRIYIETGGVRGRRFSSEFKDKMGERSPSTGNILISPEESVEIRNESSFNFLLEQPLR